MALYGHMGVIQNYILIWAYCHYSVLHVHIWGYWPCGHVDIILPMKIGNSNRRLELNRSYLAALLKRKAKLAYLCCACSNCIG